MLPKNIRLKTNLVVCLVIITGFIAIASLNYMTSQNVFMDNVEQISSLTSEGIYYRLEALFTKPVNISLTMASSPLLKQCLLEESNEDDEDYLQTVKGYLNAYIEEYGYETFFLVSAKTQRYYTYSGVDRILHQNNTDDSWYYSFIESGESYELNVDSDWAYGEEITVFVNCRIVGDDGTTLGIVGVGLRIDDMQSLIEEYSAESDTEIYLINANGDIELSVDSDGSQPVNLFDMRGYPQFKHEILQKREARGKQVWWVSEQGERTNIAAQYIPTLNWHLIVEYNTASLDDQMKRQFIRAMLAAVITGLLVFIATTYTTGRYNKRIIALTAEIEQEKQAAFRKATEQLYDNIYELNVTQNRAIGGHTMQYFESLGIAGDSPYDAALEIIAQKIVKDEYRDGYIYTFSPENVLREFDKGNTALTYDLLTGSGDGGYYWLRIMAHTYYRKEDDCICMFTYRKNIDAEKRREAKLSEQAQLDGLTNVYNKSATEHQIEQILRAANEDYFAFFIIDIDDFKYVNDRHGHAFGDFVITEFVSIIKSCFRSGDVIGRIGGDEFAVFLPVQDESLTDKKAAELSEALNTEITDSDTRCKISASIGVATTTKGGADFETLYKNADTALYETKRCGKNGYSVYT